MRHRQFVDLQTGKRQTIGVRHLHRKRHYRDADTEQSARRLDDLHRYPYHRRQRPQWECARCEFHWSFHHRCSVGRLQFPTERDCGRELFPGNPSSEWDISGAGDSTIQGFATDISVNQGGTVNFKVNTTAAAYRLDIYRMGYYGGNGARKVATINTVSGPQNQPACLTDSTSGLIDCGNWAVSASWTVPASATSGIYFAKAVRTDTGGASHIFFIVRNDASHSDILFQTSDTSWQAYNDYGGNNLYGCNGVRPTGRAFKVSYNRPFHTRVYEPESWVFNAEYPMVRWLEANGYDVSYFTEVDTERNAALIRNHKVWMSNGHDEYWSAGQRASVQAARDAGVHLAFFSGNTMFWKTRWENSIDGSNTPYRTMVCYKETHANAVIDPTTRPPGRALGAIRASVRRRMAVSRRTRWWEASSA